MATVSFAGTFQFFLLDFIRINAFYLFWGNNTIFWSKCGDTGTLNTGEIRVKFGNVTTEVCI